MLPQPIPTYLTYLLLAQLDINEYTKPVVMPSSSLIISRNDKTNTRHPMENCKAPEIRQDFTKLLIYVGIKRETEKLDPQYLESTISFA